MLAKRIEERTAGRYEATSVIRCLPKIDVVLRAKCLITVMLIAAIVMFVTMRSEAIVRAGYDLVQVKSQALAMQRENELLQLEIAKLKSPQRIKSIATSELGMVIPQNLYFQEEPTQRLEPTATKDKKGASQMLSHLKGNKDQ